MKTTNLLASLTLSSWLAFGAASDLKQESTPVDYDALEERAEAFFSEGSFAEALELYERVDVQTLDAEKSRWVRFRTADCRWRSAAASSKSASRSRRASMPTHGAGSSPAVRGPITSST